MDQRGDHMQMNSDYFEIQKWMLQTVRAEKTDGENGVICLVSISPSWVMVLKLSQIVYVFQFCAEFSKFLTLFTDWCKISSLYLAPVRNYWTWTKTIPQEKWFF